MGEDDVMNRPAAPLSPATLLSEPFVIWLGMLLFPLLAAAAALVLARDGSGRPAGLLTAGLCLPAVAGVVFQGWLSANLSDRRLFPRVLSARDRLPGAEPDSALLYLRLNLQLVLWAISGLNAAISVAASSLREPSLVAAGLLLASLVPLLLTCPRRRQASGQLAR